MKQWAIDQVIDKDSQQKLYDAFRAGRDGQVPTEADFHLLLVWVCQAVKRGDDAARAMLQNVMSGNLVITAVVNREPLFRMTEEGRAHVEKDLLPQPEFQQMIERLNDAKREGRI